MATPTVRLGRPRPVGAFFRKELLDAVRQPWLLAVMVLGPFVVLALFAVGYQDDIRPYRTLFVGDPKGQVALRLEESAAELEDFVDYRGVTEDEAGARARLADGDVDAVVVLPDDPLATVMEGEQATLRVIHRRLDPIEQTAIQFASRLAVDEINAQAMSTIVAEGQEQTATLMGQVTAARAGLDAVVDAIDADDAARADAAAADVVSALGRVEVIAGLVERLAADAGSSGSVFADESRTIVDLTDQARDAIGSLRTTLDGEPVTTVRERVAEIAAILDEMVPVADRLLDVEADVLVRPFRSEVDLDLEGTTALADYYAPAAVVLLLQQFGVAFAALSFVRERQLGILELYRVSPFGSSWMMLGKYGAYSLLGGVVGATLLGLVVLVTGVPFRGGVLDAVLVLTLVLVASVGLGFLISLRSKSDTQAVLLTMLVLLASLFFTGFFLSVDAIDWPIRAVAYLLPATYGIKALREVQLQGIPPGVTGMVVLGLYAAAIALVVLRGARRTVSAV